MATLRQTFSDIASAIRAKGVSGTMKPIEMASKIGEIQQGLDYGYLTFTAEQDATFKLGIYGNVDGGYQKLLKSNDAVNWERWDSPNTNKISLSSGQSVYIKAADDAQHRTANSNWDRTYFIMSGRIQVNGDIRSIVKLLGPFNSSFSFWFSYLFYNCTSLTSAPKLPTTTLTERCYQCMFNDCTSLTTAPELPATTLASYCYLSMFQNCTSLKRIKMNASSGGLGTNMFNGCTSLELVDMTGSTGVPQLYDSQSFDNTNDTYKIVVPDSLYDTWINATNWASIASHIMKQTDWNASHPDDILGQ